MGPPPKLMMGPLHVFFENFHVLFQKISCFFRKFACFSRKFACFFENFHVFFENVHVFLENLCVFSKICMIFRNICMIFRNTTLSKSLRFYAVEINVIFITVAIFSGALLSSGPPQIGGYGGRLRRHWIYTYVI